MPPDDKNQDQSGGSLQFGVKHLLTLVTVAAAVMAVARWHEALGCTLGLDAFFCLLIIVVWRSRPKDSARESRLTCLWAALALIVFVQAIVFAT